MQTTFDDTLLKPGKLKQWQVLKKIIYLRSVTEILADLNSARASCSDAKYFIVFSS